MKKNTDYNSFLDNLSNSTFGALTICLIGGAILYGFMVVLLAITAGK